MLQAKSPHNFLQYHDLNIYTRAPAHAARTHKKIALRIGFADSSAKCDVYRQSR